MTKKYQVFVSSTYEDLQEERQEVIQALLELDCIPSGMELFPAADESQWDLIKSVVEECDYYILIIGGRYGSLGPEGISYTEMEYRYAIKLGKPTIAFLHKDPGRLPANKCEEKEENKKKLAEFRSFVQRNVCKHYDSAPGLGAVVSRSLVQLMKKTPAVGWVRADRLPDEKAVLELLECRKQVEDLQRQLEKTRIMPPKGTEQFAQGEDEFIISYRFSGRKTVFDIFEQGPTWTQTLTTTWDNIFSAIAPVMINEASESKAKNALESFIENQSRDVLLNNEEYEGWCLQNFTIQDDVFQTIIVQLRTLGLISKSVKTRSVNDLATYWTLTPYGDEIMTRLRAIRRNNLSQKPE